ncbi:hypothetical protein H4J38_15690 [Colwellia sp. BRX10-3]|uniref:hypothetical protein n=1 Tax=Colwellia sp. BRX10-3 TaxID=2759844 RepID=UPI0015F3DE41|nr:hypothetical protein [Colwellia sp. BRX10-3]MBA6392212.1 hypothetical protein [Colwellia sp. BRX10-3]
MIAVLTGDIVNSTKMTNETYSEVIKSIKGFLREVNEKYQATGEVYRGDEFQIQYPNAVYALKSTLLIKLALHLSKFSAKPIQCTLSLAYGAYEIYDKKPNTSSGPVFIESGRGLEKAQRGELLVSFEQQANNSDMKLLNQFLNHLLNRLTKTQAELLYQYIESDFAEHKKIADLTGTTRQNISNRLGNIGAFLVRDYMAMINKTVSQLGTRGNN